MYKEVLRHSMNPEVVEIRSIINDLLEGKVVDDLPLTRHQLFSLRKELGRPLLKCYIQKLKGAK
jgi:hypothetical protein